MEPTIVDVLSNVTPSELNEYLQHLCLMLGGVTLGLFGLLVGLTYLKERYL